MAILLTTLLAASAPAQDGQPIETPDGRFALTVPAGWEVSTEDYGEGIYRVAALDPEGAGEVSIGGGPNPEPVALDDAVEGNLAMEEKFADAFELVSRERTELVGLPAVRLVYDTRDGESWTRKEEVVLSLDDDRASVVISFSAARDDFEGLAPTARAFFDSVRRTGKR